MERRSVAVRVLTLLYMGRHHNLTLKNVEIGLGNKWSTILKVMNVCKFTDADETWNLRLKRVNLHSQVRQDVEMPVEAPAESASVKRGYPCVIKTHIHFLLRERAREGEGDCTHFILRRAVPSSCTLQPRVISNKKTCYPGSITEQ